MSCEIRGGCYNLTAKRRRKRDADIAAEDRSFSGTQSAGEKPATFLVGDNKRNCCPGPRSPPFFPFYLVPAKESSCPAPRPSRNPTIDTIDRTPLDSEKSQWPTKWPATGHIQRHVGVTRYRSITINHRRISCFGRHLETFRSRTFPGEREKTTFSGKLI